ncbi:TonB-dependent receptor [Paracoccus caeni]|uniref:TonB-dependent receptor n=1 Tax=Paracoccus caeni TaxID=657651 RepID=A0A934SMG3_9RHOB|nr:TonB-dependent receptor [Paracoccus caeni]MBK4217912.1 TonB-dependent receptor [Paracoccus caeni]
MAGTILGSAVAMPAAAQESAPVSQARPISIPSGPLTPALNALAAQADLQLMFDASLTEGRSTAGASGTMTPSQALDRLLAGSAISARFAGSNQVLLIGGTPTSLTTEDNAVLLETITLYGNRAGNSLDSTFASVGVVDARAIQEGHLSDVQDTFRRLANVDDSAFANSGFVIRGLSSEGFVPAGAPVGSLYLDGVLQTRYNARRAGGSLWDTEQVEVYRGPQSTLSGRAAMSGAIYIKTKDPTFDREAEFEVTAGNNDLAGASFMLNTPLIDDQLALRFSGSFRRSKTTVEYPTYRDFAGYDDFRTEVADNLRLKLLWQPSDMPDTRAVLSYSYSSDRPNERLIGIGSDFDLDDERGDWYFIPTYAEFRQTKAHNLGLEVTHDLNDTLRLTSMTGVNFGQTRRRSVDTGTEGLLDGIDGDIDDTLMSQEIRLNYDDGRLKWVAGVFGSFQEFDSRFDAIAVPYLQLSERFNRKTTNLAAFGEATWEFAPSWDVTLGGRIDWLRERTDQRNVDTYPFGGEPFAYSNSADFKETNFVPKIGVTRHFGDLQTVGLTYSEGFRTGGFYVNYRTGAPEYYDPERARSLELSYKGILLDDRLTLNGNAFYTKYEDQQVEIRPDPNNQSYRETTNAASSRTIGFEIEPTLRVNDNLTGFASLGYLNTTFSEFNHAAYGDMAGEPFPEAPEWTVALGGRYDFDNGFWLGGDAKYTSSYNGSFGIPPQDSIKARTIVNLQAGYARDNWEVVVFADNLLDERYFTFIDRDAAPVYGQIGPRRTVGVTLNAKF